MRRYVIVGTGVAGISAAEAIRSQDREGEITLIGDDADGYYSRPGLAYYLTGEIPEDMLFPYSDKELTSVGDKRRLGRVEAVYRAEHQVRFVSGETLVYDRLLLAVGASARRSSLPGADLEGVVKLDDISDARNILSFTKKSRVAVIVGGGITALEIVEGLRARGLKVHYLLRGDRYWGNVLDEVESRIIERLLEEEGVQVHFHTEIEIVEEKRGKVAAVRTKSGELIKCQLLAIAIGIQPRLRLAKSARLETDRGILVNEYLQTNDPDIYAAGDVAQVFDPITGRSVLDSLWTPARQQGYTAGLNMTGNQITYSKGVPFNVTRLAGLTTTIIGTVGNGKDGDLLGIARGDSETWRRMPDAIAAQNNFNVNRLRVMLGEQTIIGAIVMGDQSLSRPLYKLVAGKADIRHIRDLLLQANAPIADLLGDYYTHWMQGNG